MILTSCSSSCQPRSGEGPQRRVSINEARCPIHRGTARLCTKQRLQDWGPSKWELRAQIWAHGWTCGCGNGDRTCSYLPIQDTPSTADCSRYEKVLTACFELPIPRDLLLMEGLALVQRPPSLGSTATAGHSTGPCLWTEEGVGSHVAGCLSFAPFPDCLMLFKISVRVRSPAQCHAKRGAPLSQVRAGLFGVRYRWKRSFPLASGRQRWGRGGITSSAVTTAATWFPDFRGWKEDKLKEKKKKN